MPDSFFDNKEDLDIRVFIYRFFKIKAVVSLPMLAFQPFTPTKTTILFAEKKTEEQVAEFDAAWNEAFESAKDHLLALRAWNFEGPISKGTETAIRFCLAPFHEAQELGSPVEDLAETFHSTLAECLSSLPWLLFAKTIDKIGDTQFAVAHAEQIGFKRSKRKGEMPRPNDLFADDKALPSANVHPDHPRISDFLRSAMTW